MSFAGRWEFPKIRGPTTGVALMMDTQEMKPQFSETAKLAWVFNRCNFAGFPSIAFKLVAVQCGIYIYIYTHQFTSIQKQMNIPWIVSNLSTTLCGMSGTGDSMHGTLDVVQDTVIVS